MADQNKFQKANQISSIAEEIRGGKREKPAILGGFDPISTENNNWAAANLGARAGAWYGGDGNGKKSNFFAIIADLILRFQPWHLFLGGECMLKWHLWAEVREIQQEVALDVRSSHQLQYTVFPFHIPPAPCSNHQPGNSVFLSHHSSSSLQLQPAEQGFSNIVEIKHVYPAFFSFDFRASSEKLLSKFYKNFYFSAVNYFF